MEPHSDSMRWFESGPEPVVDNLELAVLMVRIGMATNALVSQFHVGEDARRRSGALKTAQALAGLATAAALTNEAIRLAGDEMARLRDLALRAGASDELLVAVGQLCAGKHPSAAVLKRARNQLAFHWDKAVIRSSIVGFGKN